MPGAVDIDRLIATPSSIGGLDASPIKPRRERRRLVVLGSRDVLREISASPPSLTRPSILAEQANNPRIMGKQRKNRNALYLLISTIKLKNIPNSNTYAILL
jgi:hypothetical protein